MLNTALEYLAAGWRVIPVQDKRALIQWEEFQVTVPTPEQVTQWWNAWPQAGVAVLLGDGSRIVRVDVDNSDQTLASLGGLPDTAEFTSPSGGRGYLLQYESWVTTAVLWTGKNQHEELRVQSTGAYTVLPPTPGYTWIRKTPIARAPHWLLAWYAERALRDTPSAVIRCDLRPGELLEALGHISPDQYDTWLRVGMALRSQDKFAEWDTWSQGSLKYKPGECERKWAGFNGCGLTIATVIHLAREAGWKPAWSPYEPLTEGGNANILSRTMSGRALYSPKLGWLAWDSRRWTTGSEAECIVQEGQKDSLRLRRGGVVASLARALEAGPDAELKRKNKMKTLSKIDQLDRALCYKGARDLAKSAMMCDWTTFNTKGRLLNFRNGTLDLHTGVLRPHNSSDLLTTLVPHDFVPDAPCDVFLAFLQRSLPDPEIQRYVHLKLGSTLLGSTRKELLILWGPDGDNGKTLLVELMLLALGSDYAVKTASDLLLRRSSGDDDRNTVMLFGKRFAAASETNEGAKVNEALLKELTGGDAITTRYLFHEKFVFLPTHDIVYVTNHKPMLKGTDDALWNRIKLVEFNQSFPVGHVDRVEGLKDLLAEQVQGFMAWLVKGCVEYVQSGLAEPTSVKQSTVQYRQEHNPVAKFLEARYTKTDGTAFKIRKQKVAEAFRTWNQANGLPAGDKPNPVWFGRMMTQLGVGSDANNYHLQESTP